MKKRREQKLKTIIYFYRKKKELEEEAPVESAPLPEVSGEKFFQVETSLKDMFNKEKSDEQQPFSLLAMMGRDNEDTNEDTNDNTRKVQGEIYRFVYCNRFFTTITSGRFNKVSRDRIYFLYLERKVYRQSMETSVMLILCLVKKKNHVSVVRDISTTIISGRFNKISKDPDH